jgi:NTE family protein
MRPLPATASHPIRNVPGDVTRGDALRRSMVLLGLCGACALAAAQPMAQPAATAPVAAEPNPVATSAAPAGARRPRIGVALSGGGARGFAHVGVLRGLEALRIPIDCIAGTSAGSAVGAAYAAGLSPDEIESALRSADWEQYMFDDAPPRQDQLQRRKSEDKAYILDLTLGYGDGEIRVPPGLISGQKIELFLNRMLGFSTQLDSFDRLPIPFRAIATDLERGEMVSQDRGNLVTAIRASMAVPSVFAPVQSEGRLLVDGGLTRNLPVDVVRGLCKPDVVIAVDIGSPLLKRESLNNLFGVTAQMVSILTDFNVRESLAQIGPDDVLIRPELGDLGASDFAQGVDGIPAGERSVKEATARLAALSVAPDAYAAWREQRAERVVHDGRFSGIRVTGTEVGAARRLLANAALPEEGEIDRDRLERAINVWNSSGDFDRIGYSLVPDGAGTTLEIDVQEKAWGPNYLRFGIAASADSNQNGVFDVALGFRRPNFNRLGGEFKTLLQLGTVKRFSMEWFQPVNTGQARFFVAPSFLYDKVPIWLFQGDQRVAEYSVASTFGLLDVGVQGRLGEIRTGVYGGTRSTQPVTGPLLLPEVDDDVQGVRFHATYDQLDAADFPHTGQLFGLYLNAEKNRSPQVGEFNSRRALVTLKQVVSFGDHIFAGVFKAGEATDQISLNQAFSLGGFMNMTGLQVNELLGTSMRYASLSYYRQIVSLPSPIGRGVYAGLALEAGRMQGQTIGLNEDGWIPGVTAFLGASTAVGPVYLGYGAARYGNRLFYIFLGRPPN